MPDAALAAAYASLLAAAEAHGIDAEAQARETATLRRAPGGAVALPFPEPLGAIRLLVAPLRLPESAKAVIDAAVASVSACVPSDAAFRTPRHQLHVTLFHIGRPGAPAPVPYDAAAAAERAVVRGIAERTPRFSLVVERVCLSDTGVLLLLLQTVGEDRTPFALREALRDAFPAAPSKQSVLLHSSLARLLAPLDAAALAAARSACETATTALRGTELRFDAIWHVVERSLPVDGDVTELPLCSTAA